MYVFMYVCVCVCVCVCMYLCVYVCVCIYVFMYVYNYVFSVLYDEEFSKYSAATIWTARGSCRFNACREEALTNFPIISGSLFLCYIGNNQR